MKLSILSGSFGRFSIDKQFEMVKNIGFDGIDICGTRPHAYPYDMDQRRIDHRHQPDGNITDQHVHDE